MKKNLRMLLIMLAVLVVVGGVSAALLLTRPAGEEESSSSSSNPTEAIVERDVEDISSISVENTTDSFTLVAVEEGTATGSDESAGEGQFTVEGLESYPLNTSSITSNVTSMGQLYASKNLGQQENLEQFGLSGENACTFVIHYTDGSSDEIVLGSEAGETTGRYLLKDGVLYISSSVPDALLGSPLSYISTDIYSVGDRTEETTDDEGSTSTTTLSDILYHAELGGTHLEAPITIEYDDSKISDYLITSPVMAESGTNTFTEMVTALKSLTALDVAAVGRTQETLEEFGLAEPAASITFDMNGEKHTLAVSGKNEDGNRYLLADDIDLVYEVSSDLVTTWADSDLIDLRMSFVWLPTIDNVKTLTVTVEGDQVYQYNVTRTLDEEKSTEENPSYDLTIENAGGEAVDYENYQDYYQRLLSVAVLSTSPAEYDGDAPVLRVEYSYFDGGEPDVISYCPVEGDEGARYAAVLNGSFNGLVRKTDVDTVISLLPALDDNQAIGDGT